MCYHRAVRTKKTKKQKKEERTIIWFSVMKLEAEVDTLDVVYRRHSYTQVVKQILPICDARSKRINNSLIFSERRIID